MNVLRRNHSQIGSGSSHWPTATCPVTKPRCSLSTNSTCHTAAPSMAVSHMGRPNLVRAAAAAGAVSLPATEEIYKGVYESPIFEGYWTWQGHRIRYHVSGAEGGEAVLLVHGFGGNADHWRKNTPALAAKGLRVFAIDLLGYGYSDKPDPKQAPQNSIYSFPNWGNQLCSFITEVIGSPAFVVCNSVGGCSGLEAAVARPDLVRGVQLIDISLRGLHVKRTSPLVRPFVALLQRVLKETQLGQAFFASVAKPQTVRNILREAYGRKDAVTDELVDKILSPGLLPGAVDVFLDFICYSGGPLPEELLEKTTVPVSMLWGEKDPWEDAKQGKALFSGYPCVYEFVGLPGIGHCPQDEAPEVVNPLIERFVAHVKSLPKA